MDLRDDPKKVARWRALQKRRTDWLEAFAKRAAKVKCLRDGCKKQRECTGPNRPGMRYCVNCRKKAERAEANKDGEAHHVKTGDVPAPKRGPFPVPKVVLG